ncbi:DUF3887 domain-containing protein [Aurantibacter sp.]|uniref:DUF3887 domain-containing protein n=1 Tax=Aurantibacter sp. TaxID=2807103 RepID=UPI0035C8669F
MKKLVLIIAILTFSLGFSQTEKLSEKSIVNNFIQSYNSSNFENIYSLLSKDYQDNKSLDNITVFFKRFQNAYGNITSISNSSNEKGYTRFPIKFKDVKKILVLKFNTDNKIDYISINKIKLN